MMSEFDIRADRYRKATRYRDEAAAERNPDRRRQLLERAAACERRARGFGTAKGKNLKGAR
jgi:hypothetical protein